MNRGSTWPTAWSLVATVGVGLGMLEWGPWVTLGCLVAATVAAIPVVVGVRTFRRSGPTVPGDDWHRGLLRAAVVLGSAVVACWAVARLAPAVALLLLTLALVTSPAVVGLARRIAGGGPASADRAVVRPAGAAPRVVRPVSDRPPPTTGMMVAGERPRPQDLDDRALCRLWRKSFWELTSQSTPTDYLRIVAWRQCCLDEIERRDAQALHAWLQSGARACEGPEKFLRHPPGGATDAA